MLRRPHLCPITPRLWRVVPPEAESSSASVAGCIAAGGPVANDEAELGTLEMNLSAIGIPSSPDMFALRVNGDSMINAGIYDGDIVLLEKGEPQTGDIVAALIDNEMTLKRLAYENDGPVLRAANAKYRDFIPLEGLEIQGVAVGLIRKLR